MRPAPAGPPYALRQRHGGSEPDGDAALAARHHRLGDEYLGAGGRNAQAETGKLAVEDEAVAPVGDLRIDKSLGEAWVTGTRLPYIQINVNGFLSILHKEKQWYMGLQRSSSMPPDKPAKPFTPVQFRAWPPQPSETPTHPVNDKSTRSPLVRLAPGARLDTENARARLAAA